MKLFILLALVAVILAILAAAIPTSILFPGAVVVSVAAWLSVAFGLFLLDLLTGGYALPVGGVRRAPVA